MTNNYAVSDIIHPTEIRRTLDGRVVLNFGVTDLFREYRREDDKEGLNQRLLDAIKSDMERRQFCAYNEGSLVLHHLNDSGIITIPTTPSEIDLFSRRELNAGDKILITQGKGYYKEFVFLTELPEIYAEMSKTVDPARAAMLLAPFIDDYNIDILDVICDYISRGDVKRHSFDAAGID